MDFTKEPTQEEMQELIEKAQREMQEILDSMTPEEREASIMRAQEAIAQDEARRQSLIDSAAQLLGQTSPAEKPKFCPNCGAPAGGGNFCEYCGSKL